MSSRRDGRGGRRKKSNVIHAKEGTFRPERHGSREDAEAVEESLDEATAELEDGPPSWLSVAAKKEWKRLEGALEKLNVLSGLDRATFAAYCETVAELQWVSKPENKKKRWIKSTKGEPKIHPINTYRLQLLDKLRQIASEFGLTPAGRARVESLILAGTKPTPKEPTRGTGTDGKEKPITSRRGKRL